MPGTLVVDTVNGKRLPKPVYTIVDNIKEPGLPEDTRCVIRGYESGKIIGMPSAVAKAENIMVPSCGWQFVRTFVVTSVVEPASLKKE